MKNILEQKMKVSASLTDVNIEMGLVPSLSVVQDNMCEFFKNIGCDGLAMVPVCNCFFVVTKTKIKFNNFLTWLDEFNCKTEICGKSRVRLQLSTEFTKKGTLIATSIQELCAMDADQRSLRTIETTLLPKDIEVTSSSDMEFSRLTFDMSEANLVKTHSVDCTNLDFYKHTNNVEYVRIMLSTLNLNFLVSNVITDFEIHYVNECRFGDELKIYKNKTNECIDFEVRKNDVIIVKAKLNYKRKG